MRKLSAPAVDVAEELPAAWSTRAPVAAVVLVPATLPADSRIAAPPA
jgi:hypothetical protein